MSLDRRLEQSMLGDAHDFFPSHSPIEQSYDTPSQFHTFFLMIRRLWNPILYVQVTGKYRIS